MELLLVFELLEAAVGSVETLKRFVRDEMGEVLDKMSDVTCDAAVKALKDARLILQR